jgi:hypothetical protein
LSIKKLLIDKICSADGATTKDLSPLKTKNPAPTIHPLHCKTTLAAISNKKPGYT